MSIRKVVMADGRYEVRLGDQVISKVLSNWKNSGSKGYRSKEPYSMLDWTSNKPKESLFDSELWSSHWDTAKIHLSFRARTSKQGHQRLPIWGRTKGRVMGW